MVGIGRPAPDMVGKRFGRLVVVARSFRINNRNNEALWDTKCDCGRVSTVVGKNLRNGNTKSCGCIRMQARAVSMIGRRFGRLVVIERDGMNYRSEALWRVRCDCGITKTVVGKNLRMGHSRSCGCMRRKR